MNEREEFQHSAERLKAVADRERLRIISVLFAGPIFVGDLAKALNDDIAQVSHHLGVLRHAGIVTTTKHGRYIEYALHPTVYGPSADATAERSINLDGYCLTFPATTTPPASEPVRT